MNITREFVKSFKTFTWVKKFWTDIPKFSGGQARGCVLRGHCFRNQIAGPGWTLLRWMFPCKQLNFLTKWERTGIDLSLYQSWSGGGGANLFKNRGHVRVRLWKAALQRKYLKIINILTRNFYWKVFPWLKPGVGNKVSVEPIPENGCHFIQDVLMQANHAGTSIVFQRQMDTAHQWRCHHPVQDYQPKPA